MYVIHCTLLSTVGFRWSWAWNDERGEWEFEKKTKITQYRHNINTSIKKRVILSFYNVSCSLSDTWFADKRKNIFFTLPTNIFFHFWFDVFMSFDFFDPNWVPCVPKNHFSAPSKSNSALQYMYTYLRYIKFWFWLVAQIVFVCIGRERPRASGNDVQKKLSCITM